MNEKRFHFVSSEKQLPMNRLEAILLSGSGIMTQPLQDRQVIIA